MSIENNWHLVFSSKEEMNRQLIEGRIGKIMVKEHWIGITYSGDKLIAFSQNCPHQNESLVGGTCADGYIECPVHKYRFNLSSGFGHDLSLPLYPVKINEGKYYVWLP